MTSPTSLTDLNLDIDLTDLQEEVDNIDDFVEISNSRGNFVIRLTQVFITAPRCNKTPEEVLQGLKTVWRNYATEFIVVVQEKHLDGGNHLHVMIKAKSSPQVKVQSRNVDAVFGKHVNIGKVKMPARCMQYLFKSGVPICWSIDGLTPQELRETFTKRKNQGTFLRISKKLKENPQLDMTQDEDDAAFFLQHGKKVLDFKKELIQVSNKSFKIPKTPPNAEALRAWQLSVVNILVQQTERQVLWIYDHKGNAGKTYLSAYLANHYGAFVTRGGKHADIAYNYDFQPFVVFDYTRSKEEMVQYDLIEQFKDGVIDSNKFFSVTKKRKDIKLVIFANFQPQLDKLSEDRWIIGTLDPSFNIRFKNHSGDRIAISDLYASDDEDGELSDFSLYE